LEASLVLDFRSEAREHAIAVHPQESCGLLVRVHAGEMYCPCRNVCENPDEHFIIHPQDYLRAIMRGELVAVIHSHPDGTPPSEADQLACSTLGVPWHIYLVPQDQWLTINPL
jgi:proteasome lid subunit RPN8/RPN11